MAVASDVIYMVVIAMETPRGFDLSESTKKVYYKCQKSSQSDAWC